MGPCHYFMNQWVRVCALAPGCPSLELWVLSVGLDLAPLWVGLALWLYPSAIGGSGVGVSLHF